jgi:hypothetical protein
MILDRKTLTVIAGLLGMIRAGEIPAGEGLGVAPFRVGSVSFVTGVIPRCLGRETTANVPRVAGIRSVA